MPSHVESPSRIFGRTVGKTTYRSGFLSHDRDGLNLQLSSNNYLENLPDRRLRPSPVRSKTLKLQTRLNQDFRSGTPIVKSAASSAFGLHARNQALPSSTQSENNFNLNQETSSLHKNAMSTVSRTFGLVSEDFSGVNIQNNETLNSNLRRNDSVTSSILPRTFGLQTRNLTLRSQFLSENNSRVNPVSDVINYRRNNCNASAVSRTFDLGSEKVANGLSAHDNEGFIRDLRRNGSGSVNLSLMQRPFGHQLRNLTMHSGLISEGSSRQNLGSNYKNNNLSAVLNNLGEGVRNEVVGVQGDAKCSDDMIDSGGFRRPTLSRVIRGRNSLLSSRLFHNQNTDRHCKDLSNINGFNVSHISRRGGDTMSESRLALNLRSNWMENQSIAGSMLSGASMKAQFMNLLENLHHSILNIGPHVTAEAVRMEFEKAKQGLENINEMSFLPSVREPDAPSIISQSSKYICESVKGPAIIEAPAESVIDGRSFLLKSSEEVLKTLISKKNSSKSNLATQVEEAGRRNALRTLSSSKDSDDEEVARFLFKKPKPYIKRKKLSKKNQIEQTESCKSGASEAKNKVISLKEWYPIALGSDLAFCGIDEEGVTVRTEPVKKRLNNRKVELLSGLGCNLIGSPSLTVSMLPKKITTLLKNGLTDRWRVLQKELLNCQTAGEEHKKRKSKSPKVISSPRKPLADTPKRKHTKTQSKSPKVARVLNKLKMGTPGRKGRGRKSKSPKVAVPQKKSGKGTEILTRSGRTVKPPSMFWLVSRNEEVTSSLATTTPEISPKKKAKGRGEGSPSKKTEEVTGIESPQKQSKKEGEESGSAKAKVSPGRPRKAKGALSPKKAKEKSPKKAKEKSPKVKSPRKYKKKESKEWSRVHSSTEDAKEQNKKRQTRGKRKRESNGEVDSVLMKKSKLEKKMEVEVESTVEDTEPVKKKKKKEKKGGIALGAQSGKSKGKKSPAKRIKKESKKKTVREAESESRKEEKEANEIEEDFELKLDDIEIPEIGNVSGNPQLSRSQLRVVSMETPPLKYFNNNLRLLRSATPMRSPDWCISQRTESEVKRFQKRREGALKKKAGVQVKRTIVTEKTTRTVENRDLKRVMEWVAEKTVRSPVWNSKILQYVLPSRRQMEQQNDDEEEEEEEDVEIEFSKPSFA